MFRIGLLTLALAVSAAAQQIPGTFTSVSPDHVVGSTLPIVSTPTLTLSNGFTPPTVTMPQTVTIEQPSMLTGGVPQSDQAFSNTEIPNPPTEAAPADFDFGAVNPHSAFTFGAASQSLGNLSRQTGKAHVQPHKTYTNEDIDQLTSQSAPDGIYSAKLANGQPIAPRNHDGFSPASGIANMPDATDNSEATELAGATTNATVSNEDQGQSAANASPTTPATDEPQPAGNSAGLAQGDNTDSPKHSPQEFNRQ